MSFKRTFFQSNYSGALNFAYSLNELPSFKIIEIEENMLFEGDSG